MRLRIDPSLLWTTEYKWISNNETNVHIIGSNTRNVEAVRHSESMERDVEIYFEREKFEEYVHGIVLHPVKDKRIESTSVYEHPQSLDSGIIEEYLSDTTVTPQSVHKETRYLEEVTDNLLGLLESEAVPEDCVDSIEDLMIMADSVDQSLQTLRSQLNLIVFNLRTEEPSAEKYAQILEMLRNLQYLRITVNRPAHERPEGSVETRDATTQVQPRQRNASVSCSMKDQSPIKSILKTMKKNVEPENLRKNSKSVLSSASTKLEIIAPGTPKRLRSFGKGTKKAFNNLKNKL